MEKNSINCPNCGALVIFSDSKDMECSYCGSKLKNPLYEEKPEERKREIKERKLRISSQSSSEDVKNALYKKFISTDDVPLDIFNKLSIVSLKQYYLPMYYFSGRYDALWSCTKVIKRKDKHGDIYTDYQPASGITRGTFSKLVLASTAMGISSHLKKYAHVLSLTPGLNLRKSSIDQSIGTNIEILSQDRTRNECWKDGFFHKEIDSNARGAAWDDAVGWQAENFNCSTSFVCDRSELLYILIWYGQYSYKGQEYFFAMDDKLGNIDFDYSRDNTDSKRHTKIWLRLFFMVAVLIAIIINTEPGPFAFFFALIGVIFLFLRFAFEYDKSSDDLSLIKKIGKAKLCNEELPETSSEYTHYKRINQIMMWALIAIVAIWGFGSETLKEQRERTGNAKHAQELMQKHQEEERLQNEITEIRNQQNKRIDAVLDIISPNKLLAVNNNGSYQLRNDLIQVLQKLGFEKEESKGNEIVPVIGEMTTYHFNVDQIDDKGNVSTQKHITTYLDKHLSSIDNNRKYESISFHGNQAFTGIIDRLVQQLRNDGFEVTKDKTLSRIGNNPVYDCLKEITFEQEIDGYIINIKNKISFKVKSSEIKISISQDRDVVAEPAV